MAPLLHEARIRGRRKLQADGLTGGLVQALALAHLGHLVSGRLRHLYNEGTRAIPAALADQASIAVRLEDRSDRLARGRALAHHRQGVLDRRRRYNRRHRRLRRLRWAFLDHGFGEGASAHAVVCDETIGDKAQNGRAKAACANPSPGRVAPGRSRSGAIQSQGIMQIVGGHEFRSIRLRPDPSESDGSGAQVCCNVTIQSSLA